jgi:hypothetical protein
MEDNIEMSPKEIVCEDGEWIQLNYDRDQWWVLLKTVMNLRFP